MRLVSAAEMRALDAHTIEQLGVPSVVLMESAGRGVADLVARLVPPRGARVAVWAGQGNNGGDGFVVARHLANWGARVQVVFCAPPGRIAGEAQVHLQACLRSGVETLEALDAEAVRVAAERTAQAGVVVDALFGTGLQREVTGHHRAAIEAINAAGGLKVAVDIPSGLSADSGQPLGACVRADHTVTFAFAKRGLVTAPGFTFVGQLHVIDIGIPARLAEERGLSARLLDDRVLAPLGARHPLAHKGTRGHLLILAGSVGKTGAAQLCARAALRGGAGLVTLAAPEDARAGLDGRVPEAMTAWYHPSGDLVAAEAPQAPATLEALLDGKRALAAGPGVPTGATLPPLLARLVHAARARGLSVVLDADGLNHLAAHPEILPDGDHADHVVLTPHPGEAARLLGARVPEVQADRIASALALARRHRAVAVLKGARTVIAAPDGRIAISPTGNEGLGTGGTGDVLTGCVGALLARGFSAFDAACAGVYLHGAAGDLVAAESGVIGLTAGDVAEALPRALQRRIT